MLQCALVSVKLFAMHFSTIDIVVAYIFRFYIENRLIVTGAYDHIIRSTTFYVRRLIDNDK